MEQKRISSDDWKVLVTLLKIVAKVKRIKQKDIAENAGSFKGWQGQISKFFQGEVKPSIALFLEVADYLGLEIYIQDKENIVDMDLLLRLAMMEVDRKK